MCKMPFYCSILWPILNPQEKKSRLPQELKPIYLDLIPAQNELDSEYCNQPKQSIILENNDQIYPQLRAISPTERTAAGGPPSSMQIQNPSNLALVTEVFRQIPADQGPVFQESNPISIAMPSKKTWHHTFSRSYFPYRQANPMTSLKWLRRNLKN